MLKINTKENPKVVKPILIPFIFLIPGFFVFPLQLWSAFNSGPTLSVIRAPTHVLCMHSPALIMGRNSQREQREDKKIQKPSLGVQFTSNRIIAPLLSRDN